MADNKPEIVPFLVAGMLGTDALPLASGLVYSYEAGTITATKTLWTGFGMGAPTTNPVVLDSRGVAIAYGLGDYCFVVKTATGSAVTTIDNVHLGYDDGHTLSGLNTRLTALEGVVSAQGTLITALNAGNPRGEADFAGSAATAGTTIDFTPAAPNAPDYEVMITPAEGTLADVGEFYATKVSASQFTVFNTGAGTTAFAWTVTLTRS